MRTPQSRLPSFLPMVVGMLLLLVELPAWAQGKKVIVLKTPAGGIQPQAVVAANGRVHLLFFKGNPQDGDLYYVRREKDAFATPLPVNSQAGSAVAVGTIRGGQLAVGGQGRVHVVWNGSQRALPKNPSKGTPVLYARLNEAGTAFEDQRNLMTKTDVLDGGATIAADPAGRVYVAWHGLAAGSPSGEDSRQVWLARSTDDGQRFAPEESLLTKSTGACGCCAMRGFSDQQSHVYFLYRSATAGINRHMYLLASADQGKTFASKLIQSWKIGQCPMSSEAFAEGPGRLYAAWESDGQVYGGRIKAGTVELEARLAAPGPAKGRKHPALAVNKQGEVILVWTEGTGWQKGGALAWQVFDQKGRPTEARGRLAGAIPVWGLATVYADAEGRFTILH